MESVNEMRMKVVGRARTDEAFRSRLLDDPKGAIGDALGVTMPDGYKFKLMTAALAALLLVTSAVEAAGGSCAPKFMHMDITNIIRANCVQSGTEADLERCRCRSNCRGPQTLINTDEILTFLATEDGPLMLLRSRSISQINRQSYGSLRGRLYCVVIPAAQNSEWGTNTGITARPGNRDWLYSMDETELPSMEEALRVMYGIVSDHEADSP